MSRFTSQINKILLSLPIFVALVTAESVAHASKPFQVFASGEKVHFSKPHEKELHLFMARGEYEIWTLYFPKSAAFDQIGNVDIQWEGPKPSTYDLQIYWLGTHPLKRSSTAAGPYKAKEVADIAIPLKLIKAKQIQIPLQNQPEHPQYLFELHISKDSTVGKYKGQLNWTLGKEKFKIPIALEVFSLQLPEAFDLKTSIGFAPWEVVKKHYGKWDAKDKELYDLYYQEALQHRIDLHKVYLKFPEKKAQDPLKEAAPGTLSFISQTGPLFNGSLSPQQLRFSVTDLPVPEDYKNLHKTPLDKKEIENFWKRLNQSVLENGLQEKSFVYFIDEPKKSDLKQIAQNLKKIRQWAPDLRFLVTTPYEKSLEGAINLWCINLIQWDRPTEKSPAFYKNRRTEFKEDLWFYVGCNSHGCEGAESVENPDLVMDRASAYARVFPWMALRYGAEGILYYDSVYGYSHGSDLSPWTDAFSFTGYGEGNLFYPCGPLIAGCKDQQVFSSLRLKILRDGLEDVQILKMLEKNGVKTESEIQKLIPNVRSFPTRTKPYESLKQWALKKNSEKKP